MAEFDLDYKATPEPDPLTGTVGVTLENTTVKATIMSVDDFIIRLTPSGNVSGKILSGVAYPLAELLAVSLPTLTTSLIDGVSFDLFTIEPITQNVQGEQITITPANLSLATYNGMLLVQGSISIT